MKPFLHLLLLAFCSSTTLSAFDLEDWVKQFGKEPGAGQKNVDEPADDIEVDSSPMKVYEKHGIRFVAPLGVQFKMHLQRNFGSADDQTMYPKYFRSNRDGLVLNLMDTRGKIPPKSPVGRAGIKADDIIYAINGQHIHEGFDMNLANRSKLSTVHRHGLRSHLAEFCDQAFADGEITFNYLRFPKKVASKQLKNWKSKDFCPQNLPENHVLPLSMNMKGANTIRIKLPELRKEGPRGDTTAGCFHFINPRYILKDGSEILLSRTNPKNLYRRILVDKVQERRAATKFISNRPLRKGPVFFKGKRLKNYFTVMDGGDLEFSAPEGVVSFKADLYIAADPRSKERNTPQELKKIKHFYRAEMSTHKVDDPAVAKYDWTDVKTISETTEINLPLKNAHVIALEVFSKDKNPENTELNNPIDLSGLRLVNEKDGLELKPDEFSIVWAAINGIGYLSNSRGDNYGVTTSEANDSEADWKLSHAPLRLIINIPPDQGEWVLKGTVVWGEGNARSRSNNKATKLVISTAPEIKFPKEWKKYAKSSTVPMPKLGSLLTDGKYDLSNPAIKNASDLIGHALMVKQTPEGYWAVQRGSYAPPGFTTSICALGLMATGNEKYKETIKKAAHYVAKSGGGGSTWTYTNSLEVVFLSEYYLRTKDDTILSALRHRVQQLDKYMTPDFYAGHKAYPGYSGYGWVGPGGMLSLAWATASHTPAGKDERILYNLDNMLEAISRSAPNGTMPYGRGKIGRPYGAYKGQSGSVGNGPYFIASCLRGGSEPFRSAAAKRYGNPPYGNANQSHAAPDLSVLWAILASANVSKEAYADLFANSFWMICQHLHYSCYIGENIADAEVGGSTMMSCGKPWIHIGIGLLSLNAGNQNLAITGKKEYATEKANPSEFIYNMDYRLHRTYQRSWQIIDAFLGKKSPAIIQTALKELKSVPRSKNYGVDVSKVYKKYAKQIATALPKGLSANDHAYCLKLAYAQTMRLKVEVKKTMKGWEVPFEFKVNERLSQLEPAFQGKQDEFLPEFKATATIKTPDGKSKSLPVENSKGTPVFQIAKSKDLADTLSKVEMRIKGTIDGHSYSYTLKFKRPRQTKKIGFYKFRNQHLLRVPNLVLNDPYGEWSAIATLSNGAAIDLAHSIGMDRKMYIKLDGEPFDQDKTGLLPGGLAVKAAHLAVSSNWEQRVHFLEVTKADLAATLIRPDKSSINGKADPKLSASMQDFDLKTQIPPTKISEDGTAVIYDYNTAVIPEHLYVALATRSDPVEVTIESWQNNKWVNLCTTQVDPKEYGRYFMTGATKATKRLRFTFFRSGTGLPMISEIRVHKPYQNRVISETPLKN